MDFFFILLIILLSLLGIIYIIKNCCGYTTHTYEIEPENLEDEMEVAQRYINIINNYNPRSREDVPPKYEDIEQPPNYQQSNSS